MHTCSEYTYRTHRQNIIDGLSRNQYITTKILFVIALALFSAILTFITAFVIGITSDVTVDFTDFRYIYYFFVQAVLYGGMALLFALLLKKAALTIGIFFTYSFIIEKILVRYINKIPIGIDKIGQFLPLSSSNNLLFPDGLRKALNMAGFSEIHRPEYVYLVTSVVYIILCGVACYYRYKKQDL
jgi:ABC-type transport system involved in multi-copper enzyme maturation permease subunit